MTTSKMLYPSYKSSLKLTPDGRLPGSANITEADGCCPDALCIAACDIYCSFIDLLPSGPMWDHQKDVARQYSSQNGGDLNPCEPVCPLELECPSLAMYGVYAGKVLIDILSNILWPSIREANPFTASTTLDDWLDRLGWEDCYRQHCRTVYMSELSPYEFEGECGPEYCDTSFSNEFECALKHAILKSLVRAQFGVIKNMEGLNYIIEPLGATLSPRKPWPDTVADYRQGDCDLDDDEGPPCFCDEAELEICNNAETLPGCPADGACGTAVDDVDAKQSYTCDGVTTNIYPGVIAAECIARSLLPRKCPNIIFRCEET